MMPRHLLWMTAFLMLAALGLIVGMLAGCGHVRTGLESPDRLAMRTIVTKDGTRYPCTFGVQRDSHYRCYKESSRVFAPSTVERLEP